MLSKFAAKDHQTTYTSTNRRTQQTASGRDRRPSSETQYDYPDTIASTSKKDEKKKNETPQNSSGSRKKGKKKNSKASNSERVDVGFDESTCDATTWTANDEFCSSEENGSPIDVQKLHKASFRYEETSGEKEKSPAADALSGLVKEKAAVAKTLDVTTREVSESTDYHYIAKTTDGKRDKPNSESVSVLEGDTLTTLSDPSAIK